MQNSLHFCFQSGLLPQKRKNTVTDTVAARAVKPALHKKVLPGNSFPRGTFYRSYDFSGAPHNDSCLIMLREYQTDAVYFVRIFVMQSVNSTGLSIFRPAASKAWL